MPNIKKIRQCFLELQLKMSGMFFETHCRLILGLPRTVSQTSCSIHNCPSLTNSFSDAKMLERPLFRVILPNLADCGQIKLTINLVFRSQCYFASTFYSTAYVFFRIISFCFLSCILFYVACAFVICLIKYLLTYLLKSD